MPITSGYDKQRDLTIFTATGSLTFEDQMAALRAFYAGKPSRNVLWDFRKLEDKRISSDELARIIAYIKQHAKKRRGGKTALVAATDLDFGLSRMSEAYAASEALAWPIAAFYTMEDALLWIEGKP